MPHHQTIQFMRQGKHHMVIFYRKQFLPSCFYPFLLFYSAAIRAMPVPAAMILVFYMAAFFVTALIHVIAKRCSTTGFYALQYFCYCLLYTSDAADDLLCVDLG